jgi:hypothetical protein
VKKKTTILLPALVVLLSGCHRAGLVPEGVRYVTRAEWGAAPPLRPMKTHRIDRITIHHTGSPQAPGRTVEDKLRGLQRFSQTEAALEDGRRRAAWADIPYHLYVSTDGSVGEGREVRFAGESNTPYDPTGHLLVVVEGNFENEALTPEQRRTLDRLIPALARRYRVPPERIAGHKDFAQTLCPGRTLYADLPRLRSLVAPAR